MSAVSKPITPEERARRLVETQEQLVRLMTAYRDAWARPWSEVRAQLDRDAPMIDHLTRRIRHLSRIRTPKGEG